MRVLYIGGSGQISYECIHESIRLGHEVTVFNRGTRNQGLPTSCRIILGDMHDDASYTRLANEHYDAVCQFLVFDAAQAQRDMQIFTGHCDQYLFIGTASSYQKPLDPQNVPITEDVPLVNPFAEYSHNKIEAEQVVHSQSGLNYTIVRPNLTFRTVMPLTALSRPTNISRLLRGKPIVVHDDGQAQCAVMHAADFAPPFVKLLGNSRAYRDHYHLTSDHAYTWNQLLETGAAAIGVTEYRVAHVASDTLVKYHKAWEGPLHGDKIYPLVFDNSKIKSVVGEYHNRISLLDGMKRVASEFPVAAEDFDPAEDAIYDRIVSQQDSLGG